VHGAFNRVIITISTFSMSTTDETLQHISNIISIYAGILMFALGTVGNIMSVLVFCGLKTYRSLPTSVFLAAFSFTNQISITVGIFLQFLTAILGYNLGATNRIACQFIWFAKKAFPEIATTCLCLCAVDRYLMTTRSARLRKLLTVPRAYLLIGINVIIWICYGIPSGIYVINVQSANLCARMISFWRISTYFDLFIPILIPITIMSVLGLLTWKNLGRIQQTHMNKQVKNS